MDENRQLMPVPHRIFGIHEIFEAILDQSLHFPTITEKHDEFEHFKYRNEKAIVDLAAVQRVCKYWYLFIQSSNYLQKRIGMKPVVANNKLAIWNPILFGYYGNFQETIPYSEAITPILRSKYTIAVTFLVLQQLPRERHFLHQLESDHPYWYSAEATPPGRILPFLQPGASWRSLVVPIGDGKFVLSVKKFSSQQRSMHDSPVLFPLHMEHSVSDGSFFTMNDVIAHFFQIAKHRKDGAQARDILRRILQLWSSKTGGPMLEWTYSAQFGLKIIGGLVRPLSSADLDSSGISQKRKLDDISNE